MSSIELSSPAPHFIGTRVLTLALALGLASPGLAQEAADAPDAAPPAPLEGADPAAGDDDSDSGDDSGASTSDSADPATADSPDPAEGSAEAAPAKAQDDDPLYNDASRYNESVDRRPGKDEGRKETGKGKAKGNKAAEEGNAASEQAGDEPPGSDAVRDTRPEEPYEPQGLGTAVTYPIQFCAGCLSVTVLTGLLAPLSAIPFVGWILVPLIVWGATSTVMTTVGDGVGKNRGQIAWPWVAGMCVDMGCAGVSATLLGVIFGALSTVTGLGLTAVLQVIDPTMIPTDSQSLQAYLLAAGAVLGLIGLVVGVIAFGLIGTTRCASVNAAALTYTVASDTKQDDDFRFPGFFSANHGDDEESGDEPRVRSREETEQGADEGAEGEYEDEGYEDEGYEDEAPAGEVYEDEVYEDEGDFAWFWGEVGVPSRSVGSISF